MNQYGSEAGQKTNLGKSALLFSSGTENKDNCAVRSALGISTITTSFLYLDEPIGIRCGASLTDTLRHSRTNKRINLLRGTSLSLAGHGVLLQSVLIALPQYWVGTTILSRRYTTKLSSTQATFLWTGSNHSKGWTPVAWETVTRPVIDGGLGVRNVETQNRAAFAHLVWCFSNSKGAL